MNSAASDLPPAGGSAARRAPDDDIPRHTLKILVAGGFGVGKTTLVGAVSEIRPLRTEEVLTDASVPVDDLRGVQRKTPTTVAMDFARLTNSGGHRLYLLAKPGQEQDWIIEEQVAYGGVDC